MLQRCVFDYKNADFVNIKHELARFKLLDVVNDSVNIDEAWKAWHGIIMSAMKNSVSTIILKK